MSTSKSPRENAQSRALDIAGGTPAQQDRIHAANAGQGEVKPEDYPEATRKAQVEAATGRKA